MVKYHTAARTTQPLCIKQGPRLIVFIFYSVLIDLGIDYGLIYQWLPSSTVPRARAAAPPWEVRPRLLPHRRGPGTAAAPACGDEDVLNELK